jgi:hypothetical protein
MLLLIYAVGRWTTSYLGELSRMDQASLTPKPEPLLPAMAARRGDIGVYLASLGTVQSSNSVLFNIPQDRVQVVVKKFDARERLSVDAYDVGGGEFGHGFLAAVDNRIDTTSGTLACKATLLPVGGNLMVPSLFLNTRMLLEVKHGVVLVPAEAIQRDAESAFVWVIRLDQTVSRRPVQVGTIEEKEPAGGSAGGQGAGASRPWAEVKSGVSPGELVAVGGFQSLQEGRKVTYTLVQEGARLAPAAEADEATGAWHPRRFQIRLVAPESSPEPADELPDPYDLFGHRKIRVLRHVLLDGLAIARAGYELPCSWKSENGAILLASANPSPSPEPAIELDLTLAGGLAWEEITATNLNRQLAFVYQGQVLSLPVIRTRLPRSHVTIKGPMSMKLVREVVATLNAGPGPVGKPQAWEFSEPIEVTLLCQRGACSGVDLPTGQCLTNSDPNLPEPGTGYGVPPALHEWMLTNRIDVTALGTGSGTFRLAGRDLAACALTMSGGSDISSLLSSTNACAITAADVVYNWSLMNQAESSSCMLFGLLPRNQSDGYLFRTRNGCLGILEVLSAPTNTLGVRILYRRVQMAGEKAREPATQTASLLLQFRWVAASGDTNSAADLLPHLGQRSEAEKLRVLRDVVLDSKDIESAGFTQYQTDQKELALFLTRQGGRKLAEATANNVGRQLAIIWKERVVSASMITSAITGWDVNIAGRFNDQEAKQLLDLLNGRAPRTTSPQPE